MLRSAPWFQGEARTGGGAGGGGDSSENKYNQALPASYHGDLSTTLSLSPQIIKMHSLQIPSTSPVPATQPTWDDTQDIQTTLLPPNLSTQVSSQCLPLGAS